MGLINFISRLLTSDTEQEAAPASSLPEFVPQLVETGIKEIDDEGWRLLMAKDYDAMCDFYLLEWNRAEDEEKPDYIMKALRQNQIYAYVLRQAASVDIPLDIEFMSLSPVEGCPYDVDHLHLDLKQYLLRPSQLPPCARCTSRGRRYFCGVILRPKQ